MSLDSTIQALPRASNVAPTDLFAVDSGVTKSVPWSVLSSKTGSLISAKDPQFGAVGNGAVDDTAALLAFFSAAAGNIGIIPAGTYNFNPSGGLTILQGGVINGAGIQQTIINITGNGDAFQQNAYSVLRDLTIDMNGGTFSGHAIQVPLGALSGKHFNVEVREVANGKNSLLFAADGGSGFASYGCVYGTNSAPGSGAAVKVNGTDSAAVPRKFYGVESGGCTLFDFGGANNFFCSGFYTAGLLFGSGSAHVHINNMRCSAAFTVAGSQHVIQGISAGAITNNGTNCLFFIQTPSWNIADNGTNNCIISNQVNYASSWTGSGGNPSLGNGTFQSRYSRMGDTITVIINLQMGSTTTFGTGVWSFSLPQLDDASIVQASGQGQAIDASASGLTLFNVEVTPGGQKVTLFWSNAGTSTNVGAASPYSWAVNDVVRFSISYICA